MLFFSHVGFRNFLGIVPTVSIYKYLDYEVKKYSLPYHVIKSKAGRISQ